MTRLSTQGRLALTEDVQWSLQRKVASLDTFQSASKGAACGSSAPWLAACRSCDNILQWGMPAVADMVVPHLLPAVGGGARLELRAAGKGSVFPSMRSKVASAQQVDA